MRISDWSSDVCSSDLAMVLVCGARAGVLRSIPLVSGIALGVGLQFAVLGLGLGVLFDAVPGFHIALAILGTGYILWLAWKIATSGPLELHQETRPPMGLTGGAAFQWINPDRKSVGSGTGGSVRVD